MENKLKTDGNDLELTRALALLGRDGIKAGYKQVLKGEAKTILSRFIREGIQSGTAGTFEDRAKARLDSLTV